MKLTRHVYRSEAERQRDLWIGVVGWIVLNTLIGGAYALVLWGQGQIPSEQATLASPLAYLSLCLGLLPWVVNLVGLILLGVTRPPIATGRPDRDGGHLLHPVLDSAVHRDHPCGGVLRQRAEPTTLSGPGCLRTNAQPGRTAKVR